MHYFVVVCSLVKSSMSTQLEYMQQANCNSHFAVYLQVFKVKAPQYFNDYHLLRSLIYKPTYSHFSRVERLTCLWVGLLSHMALCTLYYEQKVEVSPVTYTYISYLTGMC